MRGARPTRQNPRYSSQYRSRTPDRVRRGDCARDPSPRRSRPADQRVLDHEQEIVVEYEELSDEDPIPGPSKATRAIRSQPDDFESTEERFIHLVESDEDSDEVMVIDD